MKKIAPLFVILLAMQAMPVLAEGDPQKGRQLVETCLGCHAGKLANASPNYHVPKLGGQHPEYIIAALQAYRAEQRWHPTMQANAAQLSDADITDIAAYISSVK